MHGNQLQQDKNVVAQHLLDGRRLQVGDFFWEFVGFGHRATVSGVGCGSLMLPFT